MQNISWQAKRKKNQTNKQTNVHEEQRQKKQFIRKLAKVNKII